MNIIKVMDIVHGEFHRFRCCGFRKGYSWPQFDHAPVLKSVPTPATVPSSVRRGVQDLQLIGYNPQWVVLGVERGKRSLC